MYDRSTTPDLFKLLYMHTISRRSYFWFGTLPRGMGRDRPKNPLDDRYAAFELQPRHSAPHGEGFWVKSNWFTSDRENLLAVLTHHCRNENDNLVFEAVGRR